MHNQVWGYIEIFPSFYEILYRDADTAPLSYLSVNARKLLSSLV